MALPRDTEARRYYAAAKERLRDAEALLSAGRRTGAVYLAGYTVECTLKALLLDNLAGRLRKDLLKRFRGRLAHDLEWLRNSYRRHVNSQIDAETVRHLTRVGAWSTAMRYESKDKGGREADDFVRSARAVWAWADQRI